MRILILSAFSQEWVDIQSQFANMQETIVSKCRCWRAETSQHTLLFSLTGIGTSAAAITTALLCESFAPDLIIFCGVAGGMRVGQQIGDLILANKVLDADLYQLPLLLQDTPYASALIDPHTAMSLCYEYLIDKDILAACANDVDEIGMIVTANTFPAPKHIFSDLKGLDARAIEMESSGIFKAAHYYQTPVLVVRAISNLLDEWGNDLGTSIDALPLCAKKLSQFLMHVLPKFSKQVIAELMQTD